MTHRFKGTSMSGCTVKGCGRIRNADVHGHSCTGKQLNNDDGTASCYECGRTVQTGPPIFVGDLARARSRPWFHSRQIGVDNT